jgi:hypothetical protein
MRWLVVLDDLAEPADIRELWPVGARNTAYAADLPTSVDACP